MVMGTERLDEATAELLANVAAEDAKRPDEPSLPFGEWVKKNLFSSIPNAFLTIFFSLLTLFAYRQILNFVFSEERRWEGVRVNLRGLFTFSYPASQYHRIWITLGIVLVLSGMSMGLMKSIGRGFSIKRISMWFFSVGLSLVVGILLREPSVLKDADGLARWSFPDGSPITRSETGLLLIRDDEGVSLLAEGESPLLLRESFGSAMSDRGWWWIIAVFALGIGSALWFGFADMKRRTTFIPAIPLTFGFLGLFISSVWWYQWGHYGRDDAGILISEPDRLVASTTRIPWTILWFVLVLAYVAGRALVRTERAGLTRVLIGFSALLTPFVTYFVILRDPDLDWAHVWSTDIPMALAFMVGGGLIMWILTNPAIGERGRLIATALMGIAVFNWVAAFFGWYAMLQKARISFLLLALAALAAHNFAGDARQRLRSVWGWMGAMVIVHYLATMINTAETVAAPDQFAGGFVVTIYIAVFTMIFSFPLGVILALGRTSRMPLFRVMSTIYIEVVRGIPFITILFFFAVFVEFFLPEGMDLAALASAGIAFTLFSAAYLAENIRGGLQAVRQGQYEASDALGLTTVQRTGFIILPQALRVSIPPLVGAVIATFKETSLLSIVGLTDFLRVANSNIPGQTEFLGVKREGLLFICLIYWIGSYSMSKYSQRLEKQLGVGER